MRHIFTSAVLATGLSVTAAYAQDHSVTPQPLQFGNSSVSNAWRDGQGRISVYSLDKRSFHDGRDIFEIAIADDVTGTVCEVVQEEWTKKHDNGTIDLIRGEQRLLSCSIQENVPQDWEENINTSGGNEIIFDEIYPSKKEVGRFEQLTVIKNHYTSWNYQLSRTWSANNNIVCTKLRQAEQVGIDKYFYAPVIDFGCAPAHDEAYQGTLNRLSIWPL